MTHPDPQRPTLRDEDLVARALDALPAEARGRIDAALERDAPARARFERIAAHLLVYEQLPPAPPPPPFARIAAALDEDEGSPDLTILRLQEPPRPSRRPLWIAAAASVAFLALGVMLARPTWRPTRDGPHPDGLALTAGAGIERRDASGRGLPTPAKAALTARAGEVLTCREPAEAHLGERVRVVLDAGARLRLETETAVTLEAGRAWFEVRPGAFEVRTAHGPVRVLGTAFEVDVRGDALHVSVAHGRVAAEGHEIGAGMHLRGGAVAAAPFPAGAWFRQPRLRVEARGPTQADAPLTLALVLENPGRVAIPLRGPSDVRHALWLHIADEAGRPVRELPILPAHVRGDAGFLRPEGAAPGAVLLPGRPLRLAIEIPAPFTSPGTYLCRALYRPAGRPGVLSDARRLEVR